MWGSIVFHCEWCTLMRTELWRDSEVKWSEVTTGEGFRKKKYNLGLVSFCNFKSVCELLYSQEVHHYYTHLGLCWWGEYPTAVCPRGLLLNHLVNLWKECKICWRKSKSEAACSMSFEQRTVHNESFRGGSDTGTWLHLIAVADDMLENRKHFDSGIVLLFWLTSALVKSGAEIMYFIVWKKNFFKPLQ